MARKKLSRVALVATFVGAVITASPALGNNHFQLKNCNATSDTWTWNVYDAQDTLYLVPYMTIKFSGVNQTKSGECYSDGAGYCKIQQNYHESGNYKVTSSKTIYGDLGIRMYDGLLDCNSEPAH